MAFLATAPPRAAHSSGVDGPVICALSTEIAMAVPCRILTLRKFDAQVLTAFQDILTFDETRYVDDGSYQERIDDYQDLLVLLASEKFEVVDVGVFSSMELPIEGLGMGSLLGAMSKFPAELTSCHLTREPIDTLPVSRSFIVAYHQGAKQKFAAIHLQIAEPQRVHEQLPSMRLPEILAVEVYLLLPGADNSDALLSDHILLNLTEKCRQIVDLMDTEIIDTLRTKFDVPTTFSSKGPVQLKAP